MQWRQANPCVRKSIAVLIVGITVALGSPAHSQQFDPAPSKDHPLLEVKLATFGYDSTSSTRHLLKVDFTDSSHLALAWGTLDDPALAKKRGIFAPNRAHLHILVLDVRTGQKQGIKDWSTSFPFFRFLGASGGKFLTCTGNALRLFSPNFEVLLEKTLLSDRDCQSPSIWPAEAVSPSRRTLLLSSYANDSFENNLLDLETFSEIANWTEKFSTLGISDHWQTGSCGPRQELCIRGLGRSWELFRPSGLNMELNPFKLAAPVFANDDTLVVKAWNKMAVVRVDSTVLFQVELPRGRSFGEAVSSSEGKRFAVIENRQRGVRNDFLDIYPLTSNDRVVVYSIPERRAIYAVKVEGSSPWPPWETHRNQLALSPDGLLLAVVCDGIFKLYRLPDINSQ